MIAIDSKAISQEFLAKMQAGKLTWRSAHERLGIARGTISGIKNGHFQPSQQTILKMHFWLETGEPHPIVSMNRKTHFFCGRCLKILPISKVSLSNKDGNWLCKACHNIGTADSKRKHCVSYRKYRREYARRRFGPGTQGRTEHLRKKSDCYYRRIYGSYWKCAKLTDELRKEVNNAKKEKKIY